MQQRYGWSKGYMVEAEIASGQELGQATGQFSRFRPLNTYVVIFWDKNEASIIEMQFPILGPVPVNGTDMQGRHWTIATDTTFCV